MAFQWRGERCYCLLQAWKVQSERSWALKARNAVLEWSTVCVLSGSCLVYETSFTGSSHSHGVVCACWTPAGVQMDLIASLTFACLQRLVGSSIFSDSFHLAKSVLAMLLYVMFSAVKKSSRYRQLRIGGLLTSFRNQKLFRVRRWRCTSVILQLTTNATC